MHERLRRARALAIAATLALLAACGGTPARPDRSEAPRKPGGYYLDDGPQASPPADLDQVPDAQPKVEPIKASTARPYTALGRSYTPMQGLAPYSATGVASWYGKRYHGQATASGEIYNMYAMTAAHPTLPIPSYVRVSALASGKSVIVRVNDRGPFHADRVIDLSYTAAYKLGIVTNGSAIVRVDSILPQTGPPAAVAAAAPAPPAETRPPAQNTPPVQNTALAQNTPLAQTGPAAQTTPLAQTSVERPPTAPPAPAASPAATDPAPAPAAEASVKTATPPSAPLAAGPAPGVYLQFGAFSALDNAQAFLRRMRAEMSWLSANGGVFASGGLYRVQAGPYATRDEALQAAGRVARTLDLQPLIVNR